LRLINSRLYKVTTSATTGFFNNYVTTGFFFWPIMLFLFAFNWPLAVGAAATLLVYMVIAPLLGVFKAFLSGVDANQQAQQYKLDLAAQDKALTKTIKIERKIAFAKKKLKKNAKKLADRYGIDDKWAKPHLSKTNAANDPYRYDTFELQESAWSRGHKAWTYFYIVLGKLGTGILLARFWIFSGSVVPALLAVLMGAGLVGTSALMFFSGGGAGAAIIGIAMAVGILYAAYKVYEHYWNQQEIQDAAHLKQASTRKKIAKFELKDLKAQLHGQAQILAALRAKGEEREPGNEKGEVDEIEVGSAPSLNGCSDNEEGASDNVPSYFSGKTSASSWWRSWLPSCLGGKQDEDEYEMLLNKKYN
jgi:hypothetical protein